MKTTVVLAAVAGLVLISEPLGAADLLSPPAADVVRPVASWAGPYVGVNVGGKWDASGPTSLVSTPFLINGAENAPWAFSAAAAGPASLSPYSGAFIGGGQIGYNFQRSSLLLGIEADIQGVAAGKGLASAATVAPTPLASQGIYYVTTATSEKGLDYFGALRGRLGYLVTPTLLAYVSGGFAYGEAVSKTGYTQVIPNDTPGFIFAGAGFGGYSNIRSGWTVGGGVEWMFRQNWSAKVEYQFQDLGGAAYPVAVTTDWFLSNLLAANAISSTASFRWNVVRAGLNYHFTWGAY